MKVANEIIKGLLALLNESVFIDDVTVQGAANITGIVGAATRFLENTEENTRFLDENTEEKADEVTV